MSKRLFKNPTLKDVALLAGVSVPIVSRVLRESPDVRVSPETRARIHKAASDLNYRPNALARSLKTMSTHILVFFLPNIGNPVFPEIVRGAEEAAVERGYSLFIRQLDEHSIQNKRYLTLLQERIVDGLILAIAGSGDAIINDLIELNGPFILVNRRVPTTNNYVTIDDALGAEMAVDHLIKLGHQRIAHLSGPLVFDTAVRRLQGYRKSLVKYDIPFDNTLIEESSWSSYNDGKQAIMRLLRRTSPPTAVFASNLTLAVGALAGIREMGFVVPRDISIIGFHDAPLATVVDPPLSVVNMPLFDMGYQSISALIKILNKEEQVVPLTLPPIGLIIRKSTDKPRQ